jgi:hypothetical protein
LWQEDLEAIRASAGGAAFDAAWREDLEVDAAVVSAMALHDNPVAA